MPPAVSRSADRPLFVAAILLGSFLLFLVQPRVARMALPRFGGAPNVWNSALLVFRALLLAGYLYAHLLSRMALRRQVRLHVALLAVAVVTLPVGLVALPPSPAGWEVLWVPLLLALSIGPVFFLISAQAPLMQRWYGVDPRAGAPWALYAASNLGSFAGLIAYPLLAEPWLRLRQQSLVWSLGYAVLIVLVMLTGRSRWRVEETATATASVAAAEPIAARRIVLWLALAAVPSGLMLSTTTHLTTDIFAMPLMWVIPLGLYLLSFVIAFAGWRAPAHTLVLATPPVMLLAGGLAMVSRTGGGLMEALAGVVLLFMVAVSLHARLYDERPDAGRLTLFYLTMSAGGAIGGAFTAIVAPVVFDWVWEHPLLVIGAALLMPLPALVPWREMPGLDPGMARLAIGVLMAVALLLAFRLLDVASDPQPGIQRLYLTLMIGAIGLLIVPSRRAFLAVLVATMLAQGGVETARGTLQGVRTRSYFGIYTVRDYPTKGVRTLAHGTTLHGQQALDPRLACVPTTYYGPNSGVGIAMAQAQAFYGRQARIGVVGLGTGTLAAYDRPGERWTFYEIDPAMVRYSQRGTFTFLTRCAPGARIRLGDARLALAAAAPGSLDVLAVDAFSSDSIPLHLLTAEAIGIYLRALSARGVLLVHISNRYVDLEPVLAAAARSQRVAALIRDDIPEAGEALLSPSSWVVLARDPAMVKALANARRDAPWKPLEPPAPRAWTDDHASILPYLRWSNFLGTP